MWIKIMQGELPQLVSIGRADTIKLVIARASATVVMQKRDGRGETKAETLVEVDNRNGDAKQRALEALEAITEGIRRGRPLVDLTAFAQEHEPTLAQGQET